MSKPYFRAVVAVVFALSTVDSAWCQEEPAKPEPAKPERSPLWPAARALHLKRWPCCAACATIEAVECHHIRPVGLFPQYELEPWNFISLCRKHHFLLGHAESWRGYNEFVIEDAARHLMRIRENQRRAKERKDKLKAEQDRLDAERRKDPGMSWDDRRDRLPVLAVHRLRLLNSAP